MQLVCCYSAYNQSDVSKLCRGLPGDEEVADLFISMVRWIPLSTALLFLLGEGGGLELRFVGASSSASVSSIRGMWGSESSILNSGWVIKLWIELLDSGFSNPSYKELRNAFTTRFCVWIRFRPLNHKTWPRRNSRSAWSISSTSSANSSSGISSFCVPWPASLRNFKRLVGIVEISYNTGERS